MGQTISRLLGTTRLDVQVPEGVESHYRVVDRTIFKRRVRLEFTVLYPKEEEQQQEGQQEEEKEPQSRVVIEEVSSVGGEDEQEQQQAQAGSVTAVATTAASATGTAAAEDLPPLAFVDDEEQPTATTAITTTANTTTTGPVRRASTGSSNTNSNPAPPPPSQEKGKDEQQMRHTPHRPRPQSVGALLPGGGRRLSLQGVTEAVCVGGREMSRLRLSLVSSASARREGEGGEEEVVVLGTTSVLLPPSSTSAAAGDASEEEDGRGAAAERRCQSVTVTMEGVASPGEAGAGEGESAVNVDIEQAEGFKPIQQLTEEQAAGLPVINSSSDLQAVMQRLRLSCEADADSPPVVLSQRDAGIITAFYLHHHRHIVPSADTDGKSDDGPAPLSAVSSHGSLPPLLPTPTATTTADAAVVGHTPVPPPPASPLGVEPIIEKTSSRLPTTTVQGQPPQQPPPKPLRKKAQRRKIRLSASQAELLSAGGEGEGASLLMPSVTDGMFEDLWGVDGPSPSPNVMRDGQKGKEGQQKKKVLLTPEEGSGGAAALIPDGELW